MGDDRLVSHLLAEVRHVTELRIEMAEWRAWRHSADRRLGLLEISSKDLQHQLRQQSKEGVIPTLLRAHAAALLQWALFLIVMILSASQLLPAWLSPLLSVLAPAK